MQIAFHGLPTDQVRDARTRLRDAYGNAPMRAISTGAGTPCRHCLSTVPSGAPYFILAWRPFDAPSAYAETGPIFLCAEDCAVAAQTDALPSMLQNPRYALRPYDETPRIRYGLEEIVPPGEICNVAGRMLDDPATAFVDVRNPKTGCYQCRILRATP